MKLTNPFCLVRLVLLVLLVVPLFTLNLVTMAQDQIQSKKKTQVTCLKEMEMKINKDSSLVLRKNHKLYPFYKALKGAVQFAPLIEALNLNASFNGREAELEYLGSLTQNMKKYDRMNFKALLNFYEFTPELHNRQFSQNSFLKTVLVLNNFNKVFCSQGASPTPQLFVSNFKDLYDNLFGVFHKQTSPAQQQILAHQLLLGVRNNDVNPICLHDANLISHGQQILDFHQDVKAAGNKVIPSKEETCPVCFCDFDDKDTVRAKIGCGDPICTVCLTEHVRAKLQEEEYDGAKCTNPKCEKPLKILDQTLEKENDLVESLLIRQLQAKIYKDNRLIKCPGKNCPHFVKKLNKDDNHLVECLECGSKVCLNCGNSHGEGCPVIKKKKEEDDENMRLNGFMDCPYCLTWVDKAEGTCARVVCKTCQNPFDFVTGGPWDEKSSQRQIENQHRDGGGGGFHPADNVNAEIKKDPSLIYERNGKGVTKW